MLICVRLLGAGSLLDIPAIFPGDRPESKGGEREAIMHVWAVCATAGVPGRRRRAQPQVMLCSLYKVPWLSGMHLRKGQLLQPCKDT